MPQLDNDDLVGRILLAIIDVISRRTSEGYAVVMAGREVDKIKERYEFFKHVEIKNIQYSESGDVIYIDQDINYVDQHDIGKAIKEFIENLIESMGKNAGFYFIKEVREDIPYTHEKIIRELGVNLGVMQLEYIVKKKEMFKFHIENSDILKYVFKALFDILDGDFGRNFAFSTLNELTKRLSTQYEILKYVKIHDIRYIQGVDTVSVDSDVNSADSKMVGLATQKVIQEIDKALKDKGGRMFLTRLKDRLTIEYISKLDEMGVDLSVMRLRQDIVIKHVMKALVDVLSEASTPSYAVLTVDTTLKKMDVKYDCLKYIKIDGTRYSDGIDAISISSDLDSVRPTELGRAVQQIIEMIFKTLGEEAGRDFINKFKERLGKTYLLRIEEMGVNLHMVQLRRDMLW